MSANYGFKSQIPEPRLVHSSDIEHSPAIAVKHKTAVGISPWSISGPME